MIVLRMTTSVLRLGEDPDEVVEPDERAAVAEQRVPERREGRVDEADEQQDDGGRQEAEEGEQVALALSTAVVEEEEQPAEDDGGGDRPPDGSQQEEYEARDRDACR